MKRGASPVDGAARPALDPVVAQLDEAATLLEGGDRADLGLAMACLQAVHDGLGERLADECVLGSPNASWLLTLRNELSGHLSAAATLSYLELHARTSTVLERAISTLRSGLAQAPLDD